MRPRGINKHRAQLLMCPGRLSLANSITCRMRSAGLLQQQVSLAGAHAYAEVQSRLSLLA